MTFQLTLCDPAIDYDHTIKHRLRYWRLSISVPRECTLSESDLNYTSLLPIFTDAILPPFHAYLLYPPSRARDVHNTIFLACMSLRSVPLSG